MPFTSEEVQKRFYEKHPNYYKDRYKIHSEKIKRKKREKYARNSEGEREYSRKYYAENRKILLEKQKNDPKRKAYYRKYYADLKASVIEAYGGKCVCCGDDNFEFLTIDHINGGGTSERKKQGMGAGFYAWLAKNEFPSENYRLLCMNCNFALGKYGHCPHQNLL